MELSRSDTIKKELVFGREHRDSLLFYIQKVYDDFSEVNNQSIKKYPPFVSKYLNELMKKDELKKRIDLNFSYYFWRSNEAFYFVSPNGEIIFSKGLVERFLQTEDILKVVVMECYLRNKYGVFNFRPGFSTGYKTVSDLSSLLQVDLKDKRLLNNWIYVLLKNNKTDTNSILYWMQEKIRADKQSYYISGKRGDSLKEEQFIKEYLLQKGIYNEEEDFSLQSNNFFKFKREFSSW